MARISPFRIFGTRSGAASTTGRFSRYVALARRPAPPPAVDAVTVEAIDRLGPAV